MSLKNRLDLVDSFKKDVKLFTASCCSGSELVKWQKPPEK